VNPVIKYIKLVLSILIGILVGACVTHHYYSTSFKPYSWTIGDAPIVLNCYGDDLSISKIKSAVKFWKKYGDSISFIEMNPSKSTCSNRTIDGFIILKEAKRGMLKGETLARTETKISFMKIRAATIYFRPGSYNLEWLVEHELGHAFGYKHVNEKGNIMHPNIENQGGRYWIPD